MLSQSPAATAFSWLRGSLHAPSPITLLLVGASLPFFGALFGYAHQEALAADAVQAAQTVRNSQAANEVFIEISRRLAAIRVIAAEFRASEAQSDSMLMSKAQELDSAAREWSLAYPRIRALAEAYFGKDLGGYLDVSDEMVRDEKARLANGLEEALRRKRSRERLSQSSRDSLDYEVQRAALVARLPGANPRRDSLIEGRRRIMEKLQAIDALVYNTMAVDIRDGKVGFTEEQRARQRTLKEHAFLAKFGIYPFDARTFFFTFTLLALAVLSAFRLASITGRNPWVWSAAAFLFPPVLLLLVLAAPKPPAGTAIKPV